MSRIRLAGLETKAMSIAQLAGAQFVERGRCLPLLAILSHNELKDRHNGLKVSLVTAEILQRRKTND